MSALGVVLGYGAFGLVVLALDWLAKRLACVRDARAELHRRAPHSHQPEG